MIDRRLQVRPMQIDNPVDNPFDMCPLRELARRTGQDPSNLSKYRTGKLVLPEKLYWQLMQAAYDWYDEQAAKYPARKMSAPGTKGIAMNDVPDIKDLEDIRQVEVALAEGGTHAVVELLRDARKEGERNSNLTRANELRLLAAWCAENLDPDEDVPMGSPAELVFSKIMRYLYRHADELEAASTKPPRRRVQISRRGPI